MLYDVKALLGVEAEDHDLDEKLNLILSMTTARLKLLLGGITPPESMNHIITEVAVIRFNRIGSEGMTSHTVEGESQQFSDDDFLTFIYKNFITKIKPPWCFHLGGFNIIIG